MALLPQVELDTHEQKASYGFGLQFGEQLRRNDFDGLDIEAVVAGLQHWYEHREAALTDDQINPSFRVIKERQHEEQAQLNQKRETLAEQFLAANAARDGVSTTDSGLQYEVLEAGSGERPGARATVVTH